MQQWPEGAHVEEMAALAAVAEQGSFAKAAESLRRDATVLTRRIQALERRLGVRLLERTTRRVTLTEAGARFLARTQDAMAVLMDAQNEAAAAATGEPSGTLRLALPGTFGRKWIAPYLSEFLTRYPQLRIHAEFSNRFVDLIGEGFDAAVRLGVLADSSLVARKIAERRRLLCASPGYLERRGTPARPEDLRDHVCLGFTGFSFHPDWTFTDREGQRVTVRIQGPLVADDAEALVAASVSGLGIMMSTDWLVGRELADGTLVPFLSEWMLEAEAGVYAIVPSRGLQPAKTRAFVDWIAARFAPIPPWRNSDQ
jgi:DNA-binding transcriptional LysR family regulator